MKETYLTVTGRIRSEVQELEHVIDRTQRIWQTAQKTNVDYYIDAVALNLHSFYAGLERIFEVVAANIDRTKPEGPHWHQDLLRQMATPVPEVRPPILRRDTRDQLDRYRGFRHVVRNVYTFNFDVAQIEILLDKLPKTWKQVEQDLLNFADFLERV